MAFFSAIYVTFVLFLPFLAPVTFIPIFLNENTDDYNTHVGLPLIQGYVFGYLAWNVFFSIIFARVLYRYYFDKRAFYPPIAHEISLKCVIHCIISSFAVLEFYFFGIQMMKPFVRATSNCLHTLISFLPRLDHCTLFSSCPAFISFSIRKRTSVRIEEITLSSLL